MRLLTQGAGPHSGRPIALAGAPVETARAVVVALHGRGGDAADMLALARQVAGPDVAVIAPQAAGRTWYPYPFTAPVSRNEPHLSSALSVIKDLAQLVQAECAAAGIVLLGFSQGACLALEAASRHAGTLAAVIGLSGGLIGETVAATGRPRHDGLPVFLGCSEHDPHIPLARVRETELVLRSLGAIVTARIYPGASHGVNADELQHARRMVAAAGGGGPVKIG